ncbi:MAG: YraN family protein [Lachnospiraceae bacterium]
MNKREVGNKYEDAAASYLIMQGYRILERNFRIRSGEIDIIAESPEGVLVYCEVKYRHDNSYGTPLEAVNYAKRRQISRAAVWHYTMNHYKDDKKCRFDVIGIYGDGRIEHIENAFDLCR